MQNFSFDDPKYSNIKLICLDDNPECNQQPFFIRRYNKLGILEKSLHRHSYMQINYIINGRGRHVINNGEFEIIKGDIFVIPPYIPHKVMPLKSSDIEIYELEFDPALTIQGMTPTQEDKLSFFEFAYLEPFLVGENQVKPRLNLTGETKIEVESILDEIMHEYTVRAKGFDLIIKALILKILVVVGRAFSEEINQEGNDSLLNRHRESIHNTIKYIEKHYTEDICVEDAAKMAMLSQSYFCYIFKNITSRTLIEYVNDLRILKSMELLKCSTLKVGTICFDVGFKNISHFNRLFKQYAGISPTEYRKLQKNSNCRS